MPTPSKHSRSQPLVALGEAIRAARKMRGLSQESLAQALDMDRSYIGSVERGENSVALIPLIRIAETLGTSVAKLMEDARL